MYIFPVGSINDSAQHVSLETACGHTMLLWRIQELSVLVVVVDSAAERSGYFPQIEEALEIIEQGKILYVCRFGNNNCIVVPLSVIQTSFILYSEPLHYITYPTVHTTCTLVCILHSTLEQIAR